MLLLLLEPTLSTPIVEAASEAPAAPLALARWGLPSLLALRRRRWVGDSSTPLAPRAGEREGLGLAEEADERLLLLLEEDSLLLISIVSVLVL